MLCTYTCMLPTLLVTQIESIGTSTRRDNDPAKDWRGNVVTHVCPVCLFKSLVSKARVDFHEI